MARYRYRAYNAAGALATGEISAGTRESALEALARRGEMPFDIAEAAGPAPIPWWQRDVFGGKNLSAAQLAGFTRELASLVKAEIPIDEALRIVALQPMLPSKIRRLSEQCLERVVEGASLSDALSACDGGFPDYYVRLIRAGETGGALSDVLNDLAIGVEKAAEARSRIATALFYPAVLLVAAAAAMTVILMVLVPTIVPIFKDAGTEAPFMIRLLDWISQFLSENWAALAALLGLGAVTLISAWNNTGLRRSFDHLVLRIPLIGTLISRRETARLARTLSLLHRNGVPLIDSLTVCEGVLTNSVYRNAIGATREEVRQGSTLSAPLASAGIFPDLFLRLTAVGEKTGQLDAMMLRVAEIYEQAVERQSERLTGLITPVLTLLIGATVGGLIISVMGAIFSVNDLALK